MRDKGVIFQLFVPQDAPTNLAAQFSLADQPIYGPYISLQPGIWNTIAWSTSDAPLWDGAAEIELHLILGGIRPGVATDKAAFDGLIYLDGIKILPLYRNYPSARSFESSLQPVFTYNFNDGLAPELLYKSQTTTTVDFSPVSLEVPTRQNALQLDLKLPALTPGGPIETYGGGVCLPMHVQQTVDVVNASILLADDSGSDGIEAVFAAYDEPGNWYFSEFVPLTPGEWTPTFWGTGFGFFGDQWYEWDGSRLHNLCLWVISLNGYEGPVYIDNFVGFQVHE